MALGAALVVMGVAPKPEVAHIQAVSWLSILGFVSVLQVHALPKGASGSTAFIPWLATALIAPNWLCVVAVVVASVVAELTAKRAPLKAVFNVAQLSLAISLAILSYGALGGVSLLELGDLTLTDVGFDTMVPLAALVGVFLGVNTTVVAGVVAISEKQRLFDVWKQNNLGTIVYDVCSAPIVFLFAWLYVRTGALGVAGLSIPLLGARQLYKVNRQLEQVNEELLQLMVKAIEARDPYTSGHSRRVAQYSKIIARAIGLSTKQVDRIGVAALLHDVGKIHEIYAPILRKPGKLTPDEWAVMKSHPIKSAELVATVSGLKDIIGAVRHHHESWDGSGYPDGLVGEAIPLGARIIKFADTIDAMTSDRPYRRALTERDVRHELNKFKGVQFDPSICGRLLESPSFRLLFVTERRISLEVAAQRSVVSSHRRAVGA